jgi:hypothetical protein
MSVAVRKNWLPKSASAYLLVLLLLLLVLVLREQASPPNLPQLACS